MPRQQLKRRQTQERKNPQGQCLGQAVAVRVRSGGGPQSLRTEGQVRRVKHSQGTQEIHRGAGTQDVAHALRHAEEQHVLPGQGGRLRGLECPTKCAPLDKDAAQARPHACRHHRLITHIACRSSLRLATGHASPRLVGAVFHANVWSWTRVGADSQYRRPALTTKRQTPHEPDAFTTK